MWDKDNVLLFICDESVQLPYQVRSLQITLNKFFEIEVKDSQWEHESMNEISDNSGSH
jgi:hypothetical protein